MYIRWFVEFLFEVITQPFRVGAEIIGLVIDVADSLFDFLGVLPAWLFVPFYMLIAIAVLFRVSQFVPTIGGAK